MKFLPAILLVSLVAVLRAQPPLRLHGSTTVQGALESRRIELQSLVGRELEFNPTGSNAGLISLAGGHADVAMISTPLEEIARILNRRNPGTIEVGRFSAAPIGHAKIAFIVNPRNRVRTLSARQLGDMFTGRIRNWRDVGGDDAPILVVSLANAGSLVQDALMNGEPFAAGTRLVSNANRIPGVVSQEIHAVGIISAAHVKGPTSLVQTDAEILTPLFLVTTGAAAEDCLKLVTAARKMLELAD